MKPLLALALALLLIACAPPGVRPDATPEAQARWELRHRALAGLEEWSMTGRVAVQGAEEGWNATVHWRQNGEHYDMRLITPLGGGAVQVRGDPSGVVLRTADGQVYFAEDAEALLREHAGLEIPVSGLRHWVVGRPDPGHPSAESLDGQGRLLRLRQSGWDIAFRGYREVGDLELPERIFLEDGFFEVRLAINQWQVTSDK